MNETAGSDKREVKNCFSVDVEGFIESNLQSFYVDKKYMSTSKENYEIETNVNSILKLLDDLKIRATFFFLGRIGRDIPHIVKQTAECRHEIACHSHEHLRIFGLTEKEFKENLIYAKKTLEDVSGKGIYGFRAPDFSITKSSLWALDMLSEAGFIYDSSICPTGIHDVYGIGDANPHIHRLQNGIVEFPVSVVDFFDMRLPFGGGGYFRLYPLSFTKHFVQKTNKSGHSCMLYIHPYEVGPVIPVISELSYYRKFRHYYKCKNGGQRIKNILKSFRFNTAIDILRDMKFFT